MGKMIRSRRDTCRDGFIRIRRSCLVVSSFMIGGWMTGTRAMYGVGGDRDGPQQLGCEFRGKKDGGRPVGTSDDADRTGFLRRKTKYGRRPAE